jgi:hypothetical protein
MKESLLALILITFTFITGSLIVTADSISNEWYHHLANDEEPDPFTEW